MKRLISISGALVLLAAILVLPAYASGLDMACTGSITATMVHDGQPVPGGSLTLYRVADIDTSRAVPYVCTNDFAGCEVPLTDPGSETAVILASYAYYNEIPGDTRQIGDEGVVKFEDLKVGLYLLVQWESGEGYYELNPFLISVPNNEDGVYVYDIRSAPKQNPAPIPTEPPSEEPTEPPAEAPTEAPTEIPTEPPTVPDEPGLPQTGMTNWPVPILAVCGVFFLTAGLALVIKEKSHEV